MSDVTFWHEPETDQWMVKDGARTETISPFLREAFIDYHQREMRDMRIENDDLIDEAAAIREQNDSLRDDNAKLRKLVRDMWKDACQFDGFWDYVNDDGEIYSEDELPHYQERMRDLGIEVNY